MCIRDRYTAEGTERLAAALNQAAPLDLRVNSLKAGRQEVLTRLLADGLAAADVRQMSFVEVVEDLPSDGSVPLTFYYRVQSAT